MPPSFLVYIWIYFIPLFLICNKICKAWEASEADDVRLCVYSGCVLLLWGAVWGRGSQRHSSCSLPGRALCTDWGRNGFSLAGADCIWGPFLAKQTGCGLSKARVLHAKLDFTLKLQGRVVRFLLRNWGVFVIWIHAKLIPCYLYEDKVIFRW